MASAEIDKNRIAEAAIWVARLQSDVRAPDLEQSFRAWLAASDANRAAFEAASDSWDIAGGARIATPAPAPALPRRTAPPAWAMALAASLVLATGTSLWFVRHTAPIETAVGERRLLALSDGSRVTLNTATELRTRFTGDKRLVILDHGEASFEVAHDTLRPFVVQAGGTQIVAVGTVFDVRWTEGHLAVTLAEGKVRVVDTSRPANPAHPAREVELRPGQRFEQTAPAAAPQLARVDLPTARAWRTGHVVFADVPLADAVRELNRYSAEPLGVEGERAAQLRISGAFRAGDSPQFARAVAQLYRLTLTEKEGTLVLADE